MTALEASLNNYASQSIDASYELPKPDLSFFADECSMEVSNTESFERTERNFINMNDENSFKIISPNELEKILTDNHIDTKGKTIIIIDARFEYEFISGHIIGAKNVRYRNQLYKIFSRYREQNVVIIFHCEFSSIRGPTVMKNFRKYDRAQNIYPHLSFPELYLLQGGFKRFYEEKAKYCVGTYLPMLHRHNVENGDCRKCNAIFKREMVNMPDNIKPLIARRMSQTQFNDSPNVQVPANDFGFSASQ